MTQEIILSQGFVALVDDEDYEWISQWKWSYNRRPQGGGYAFRVINRTDMQVSFRMHRVILKAPADMYVVHINHDTLDNRRANLRLCTRFESSHSRGPQGNSSSQYKGITWDKRSGKWIASIHSEKDKQIYLGYFQDEIEAARKYDEAARHHYGKFAYLNFPDENKAPHE